MQDSVALSIVMPVFNHSAEVIEMIQSIQNNSYSDWELLAIDDGSDEAEFVKVQSFVSADSRISYIPRGERPKGAQTCRNLGFSMSKGKYVCFFDSDDYVAPYCLQQRVEEISSHSDMDFVVFRSGKFSKHKFDVEALDLVFGYAVYEDDIKAFCQRTLPFVVWNNIYRKSSLLKYNISWDTNLLSLQDAQFNLQTLLSGMKYMYSSKPADYGYRVDTEGSISKNIMSKAHVDSNLYAVKSFYNQVQGLYGHKYDHSLYRGAMYVFAKMARNGSAIEFAEQLVPLMKSYSKRYGMIFSAQLSLSSILSHIVSPTLSRRIAMFPYLVFSRYMERRWIPARICSLRKRK